MAGLGVMASRKKGKGFYLWAQITVVPAGGQSPNREAYREDPYITWVCGRV